MEHVVVEENDHAIINLLPEEININNNQSDTEEDNEKDEEEEKPSDETEHLVEDTAEYDVNATNVDETVIADDCVKVNDVTKDNIETEENDEKSDSTEVHTDGNKRKCCCCMCVCCRRNPNRNRNMSEKVKKKSKQKHTHMNKSRCQRCGYCCKRFLAFLFSHIGLCSLVVAYAILGGFIFMKIEAPEESVIRHDVEAKRKLQVERLWNLTRQNNVFHPLNWTARVEAILEEFQKDIYTATKEKGWDGKKDDGDPQWTFAGSLLYSITVITTIGYGNIAPKTNLGRLITMVYAIIGIPLTLLCLANLGSMLGDCFRFLYKHFCKIVICLCCPQQAQWYVKRRSKNLSNIPATDIHSSNKGSEGSKEITLEKGEMSNGKEQYKNIGKEEPVRVPIFVSLMLIASYIVAGAVIFSSWEEGWDLIIGSYFCFITLSTIGFGDYVPGSNSYSFDNQQKMVICCLYLVFGLSMVAMCFNLMQEEVRAKFRWLGQKLGIIENK